AVELLARISGDCHWNVEQTLVAPPCGDDDFLIARSRRLRLRLRIARGRRADLRIFLGRGCCRSREKRRGGRRAEQCGACRNDTHLGLSPSRTLSIASAVDLVS